MAALPSPPIPQQLLLPSTYVVRQSVFPTDSSAFRIVKLPLQGLRSVFLHATHPASPATLFRVHFATDRIDWQPYHNAASNPGPFYCTNQRFPAPKLAPEVLKSYELPRSFFPFNPFSKLILVGQKSVHSITKIALILPPLHRRTMRANSIRNSFPPLTAASGDLSAPPRHFVRFFFFWHAGINPVYRKASNGKYFQRSKIFC